MIESTTIHCVDYGIPPHHPDHDDTNVRTSSQTEPDDDNVIVVVVVPPPTLTKTTSWLYHGYTSSTHHVNENNLIVRTDWQPVIADLFLYKCRTRLGQQTCILLLVQSTKVTWKCIKDFEVYWQRWYSFPLPRRSIRSLEWMNLTIPKVGKSILVGLDLTDWQSVENEWRRCCTTPPTWQLTRELTTSM